MPGAMDDGNGLQESVWEREKDREARNFLLSVRLEDGDDADI